MEAIDVNKNSQISKFKDSHLLRTPKIDVEFQDLTYTVRAASGRSGTRSILKNINGQFRAGELTALMGPSGAGKSTLMNILAGYVSSGVTGLIKMNDYPRDIHVFNKISTYIMQEDLLQPRLTIQESMCIAANLKLGPEYSQEEKLDIVDNVLTTLGLTKCRDTRAEMLSGGQRKRLSVALELVSNPTVIFLDEPTTGLDVFAIKQCVTLLRSLAKQGRTIVCTIHQPSAAIFKMFDQVYFLAKGQCVYNGDTKMLVPFLSSVSMPCPTTYNPADYIIEIIQSSNDTIKIMSTEIQNGRACLKENGNEETKTQTEKYAIMTNTAVYADTVMDLKLGFATSFWSQFCILLSRKLLQTKRNRTMIYIQLAHHVISGCLLGGIFYQMGNDATHAISNFKFCLSVLVFFMYTHIMVPALLFPAEVKLLRREYFNRWYGLKAYYAAHTVSTIPSLILFGMVFIGITYLLSNQPMDAERFLWFSFFGILVGFCSEGLGLAVGSLCSVTNGSIVAPASITPLLALCVYGMGYGTAVEPLMAFLMTLSYLRYGLVGFTKSVFGMNRTSLTCYDDLYCHYKEPTLLLRDLGMEGATFTNQIIGLCVFIFIYRLLAYLALRYRLTAEFSNKILNYAAKVLRHK